MRRAASVLLVASLLGCTTTPGANEVRVTRNAADVEHCKPIGAVQTIPPYALPGDDLIQIRAKTTAVGADTVLLNTSRVMMAGIAYRCRKV
jgi:hypothetical protein